MFEKMNQRLWLLALWCALFKEDTSDDEDEAEEMTYSDEEMEDVPPQALYNDLEAMNLLVCSIMFMMMSHPFFLLENKKKTSSSKRDNRLPRIALPSPDISAWVSLFKSSHDNSMIQFTGLNHSRS